MISALPELLVAWTAYCLLTVSPGPANLAIIATSMSNGRRCGLLVAAGVITGSVFWGTLAALGFSALLAQFGLATEILRIAGALFLIWLGYKSLRAALAGQQLTMDGDQERHLSWHYYLRGLGIHLLNPKAIFGWMAIISVGVEAAAPVWLSFAVVAGCALIGCMVFGGYAVLFSSPVVVDRYLSAKRWIDGAAAAFFGAVGLKLLLSRDTF